MDPTDAVKAVCENQAAIVHYLAWAAGVMPVASALAWVTARWKGMPPALQRLLQVLAGDLVSAVLKEPIPAPQLKTAMK